jgi:hypothetical protein
MTEEEKEKQMEREREKMMLRAGSLAIAALIIGPEKLTMPEKRKRHNEAKSVFEHQTMTQDYHFHEYVNLAERISFYIETGNLREF